MSATITEEDAMGGDQEPQGADAPSETLLALAEAYGVSPAYWSFFGEHVTVPASTLRALLGAMRVDLADEHAALVAREEQPWRRLVPDSVVTREGSGELALHVADGCTARAEIALEDGSVRELALPEAPAGTRTLDGDTVHRFTVALPADLPLGWHEIRAEERTTDGDTVRTATGALVVTPHRLADPPSRDGNKGRAWGVMAQLYSVRSRASWGMGDFADLAALASTSGAEGADFLLINPIHAAEVTSPIEPSPYLPASRRFIAPLYVRPEGIPESADLSPADRRLLEDAREPLLAADTSTDLIDRDAVWGAKRTALERIFAVPLSAQRRAAFDAFTAREARPLADFALWCALQEHFEGTDPDTRPDGWTDIGSPLVAELRMKLAGRIAFHLWLQWVAEEQLAGAQRAALDAGMRIGIMHDLAVGVHPLGADAWSGRGLYASGVTVGAPPDMYNQQGQDWSQPPWMPDALAAQGYRPLRDLLRGLLRHAGALRIDHIIGLFRLWWIPPRSSSTAGTYVHYDHEAMIGILALEAQRAGAVIIGEDLGNVEPWVRDYLAERGVLGTSVLWFENDENGPLQPEGYRRDVLATVTTHDLPPTAGYLAGEHVELRARLGLLERPLEEERAIAVQERDAMLQRLRDRWILAPEAGEEDIVLALHRYLAAAPSRLLGVALVDAVGERRAQNQPGTYREYPNWRVPLAGPDGEPVLLDDLAGLDRFRRLTAGLNEALTW
ncbi:4-alpha-glucanotransferase [Microbacterium capsulatum]|uniref:4-alpha-glucanotransferase n=1 Tax=Microbacterium capsulatum TaxID=3041921 RepID=A0ABU0XGC4_9MICO|nr:4-alpha-glucanotransferase [Microbacterium sp. ASV81]MDQ4214182.1 4-alpha-glucanotransferase [Microbacterium sp. ASV81]